MLNIDTSDRKEQRNFGLVVGAVFLAIGLLRFYLRDFQQVPYILWSLGGALVLLGAVAPPLLKPVFVLWIKLALVLNWIMTRVMLAVTFYLILSPAAILYRLFSGDPLKRALNPGEGTYWEEPEAVPAEIEAFKHQF